MRKIKYPIFNETNFREDTMSPSSSVVTIYDANEKLFLDYIAYFKGEGADVYDEKKTDTHSYVGLRYGADGIFLNFFINTCELFIVYEENSKYFNYTDRALPAICEPQITQVNLIDFGMSYVVRLSDGRFIIIDGGNEHDYDSDALLRTLKAGNVREKIEIAAWIFTHPHLDHFHCFLSFMDRFFGKEDFAVEKFIFNFPVVEDTFHYPALIRPNEKILDTVPRMYAHIKTLGAPIYTARTGQTYKIGDATCEVLTSLDDVIHFSKTVTSDLNTTSLVIRMELGGEVILWAADSYFEYVNFAAKHGEYLKSDILQVPHHGFGSARPLGEIEAYKLVRPRVCLMPVCDYDAYTSFCTHVESSRYLMLEADIDELITGDEQRTLTLPYTPRADGRETIIKNFYEGLVKAGGYEWEYVLTERDDLEFEIRNGTHRPSVLTAEFFDENENSLGTQTLEMRGNFKTPLTAPEGTRRAHFDCTRPLWVKHTTLEPTKRITTNV